jgi:hypothetical protein
MVSSILFFGYSVAARLLPCQEKGNEYNCLPHDAVIATTVFANITVVIAF